MKNKTIVKTQSVTNTQIATAVAALFLAGGLAFASLPISQKNIQKKNPAVVLAPQAAVQNQAVAPVGSSPISIDRCGTPEGGWQSGKTYRLSADITTVANSFVPCFVIDRDNVTLDGRQHRILAAANSTNTGIRVQNSAARVTLQNISFDNFQEVAITSDLNITGLRILNNTFTNNKKAVLLGGGNTHEVIGNTIIAPSGFRDQSADTYRVGLHLGNASSVTVRDNRFEGLLLGIFLSSASNNTFERNAFVNNQLGVYLSFSSSNVFLNNTYNLQSLSAFYIRGTSASNNISNNTFSTVGGGYFSTQHVASLNIDAPFGFANELMPVDITKLAVVSMDCSNTCTRNNFTGNIFNNSGARPFVVKGTDRTTILSNQINGINWSLEFTNTQNLTFRGNSISNVITESNLIEIFGAGTTQMTFEDNNLCRNFTPITVFCARDVPVRNRFASVRGNSLVNSNCADTFANSTICQN